MRIETTARICREDLKELLETEAPAPKQRITARMPAVTLTNLLTLREEDLQAIPLPPPPRVRPAGTQRDVRTLAIRPLTPPPTDVVVSFRAPAAATSREWPLNQWPDSLVRLRQHMRRHVATMPRWLVVVLSACATLVLARLVSLL